MGQRLSVFILFGGIALAVLGLFFVAATWRQSLPPLEAAAQPTPLTMQVVVAAHALPVRGLIAADSVTVVAMPAEFVPLDAVVEPNEAIGMLTKIPLATGEILMRHHLADPTNSAADLALVVEESQVVLAFPATDLMSEVDVLQPGDVVDILVSMPVPVPAADVPAGSAEAEEKLFTFSVLQRLPISAIVVEVVEEPRETRASASSSRTANAALTPTPTPGPEDIEAQAILLALAPQDALVLKHLKDAGGMIDLVLRSPTASQNYDLDPVTAEYLRDRFELVVTR